MIIYKNTAIGFKEDVDSNNIVQCIESSMLEKFGRRVAPSEKISWQNSLGFMERIVRRSGVSDDCGILVEYVVPATANRVDFIISGQDENQNNNFIIVELKQWQTAESTDKDGIVKTFLNGGLRETTHPSYQANSYMNFLKDYNEDISDGSVSPYACAVLHNYIEQNPEPLKNIIYSDIVSGTPIYFKGDQEKLEKFIKKYVGKGKGLDILYKIESGRIKPTKKLIDYVSSLFLGNKEFVLLDEQKVAFELAYHSVIKEENEKSVVIIKGGPGTGKSVISMNLLGEFLKKELNVKFVAPNSSFRDVMTKVLSGNNTMVRLNSLFKGSAGFVDSEENTFDVIIVDEAHRLKNATAYQYMGKNQVEDIVKAAKKSVFFVDDNQIIRPEDIGSTSEVFRVAKKFNAKIYEIELTAQFRCAGAEGYINWLDDVLQIRETANFNGWDKKDFDFKIFSNPNDLYSEIKEKNKHGHKARVLAGYAWKWTSANDGNTNSEVCDVEVPEFNFKLPWNSRRVGTTWAIDESGIDQIGCIHTSQGLEFDYIGVIIGDDLKFNTESLSFYTNWNSYKDIKGKQTLKNDPKKLNMLVKNIYKILMTRGMKGCYVYFVDKETENYFKRRLNTSKEKISTDETNFNKEVVSPYVPVMVEIPLVGSAPCGGPLMGEQNIEDMIPVDKNKLRPGVEYFIVRAVGDSMNKAGINEGDLVLCRFAEKAETGDKVVALLGGEYVTIKYYDKNKEGRRILLPKSTNSEHQPIIPEEGDMVQGIVQEVLI